VYKAYQNSWLYTPFGGIWCIDKGVIGHAMATALSSNFYKETNIFKPDDK
jgi:hypothetical protein